MLYVTVCYVCCLCYKIPMRCHWCCCFRYIRNPSLFFSFGSFSLNLYIILYILRSLWVQEHANVVSLCLFLNVRFFVCQVVCFFVLFMCFHPLLLKCQTVEGRHTVSHLLYCGFLSFGRQVSAVNLPPCLSLRVVCLVERVTMRYMVSDRLLWEINLLCHPTPPPFLVPSVPYILVRFVLIRSLSEPKSQYPHTQSCPYRRTSYLSPPHPSSQPLRVDVAVLSTSSSRGQDPSACSSVCLTLSCSIWHHHT